MALDRRWLGLKRSSGWRFRMAISLCAPLLKGAPPERLKGAKGVDIISVNIIGAHLPLHPEQRDPSIPSCET